MPGQTPGRDVGLYWGVCVPYLRNGSSEFLKQGGGLTGVSITWGGSSLRLGALSIGLIFSHAGDGRRAKSREERETGTSRFNFPFLRYSSRVGEVQC